jgi:uncharacterized membrane protein YraQ (UPF0718 family)
MRKAVGKYWPLFLFACVAALWAYSLLHADFVFGRKAGENLGSFLVEMASVLPPMFLLVGLFEIWVPRKVIERYAGLRSGMRAVPWMILLATLQAGPLYVAFPVAIGLWRKGCAPRNVFIYLGAFSAMKIPMLTFEVAFLGWRFSLARTLISIPVFIVLAVAMEKLLPGDFRPPALEGPGEGADDRGFSSKKEVDF